MNANPCRRPRDYARVRALYVSAKQSKMMSDSADIITAKVAALVAKLPSADVRGQFLDRAVMTRMCECCCSRAIPRACGYDTDV